MTDTARPMPSIQERHLPLEGNAGWGKGGEVWAPEQAADGVWLGGVQAVPQAVRAIRHQHVVGVLAEGNVSLLLRLGVAGVAISRLGADPRPPHPPAPLPAQPPGQLLCQHLCAPSTLSCQNLQEILKPQLLTYYLCRLVLKLGP